MIIKKNTELKEYDILIGDSEGMSAIHSTSTASAMNGCIIIYTEHGPLYLDIDGESSIIGEDD